MLRSGEDLFESKEKGKLSPSASSSKDPGIKEGGGL